jgi:uncharacterized protein YciI
VPFFVHGEDKPGVLPELLEHAEAHWSYMDRFDDRLILRGPTLSSDGEEHTGSIHVVDLDDRASAERFAFEEPFWLAGLYRQVTAVRAVVLVNRSADVPRTLVTGQWSPAAPSGEQFADSRLSFLAMLVDDDGSQSTGIVAAVSALPDEALGIVQPVADQLCGEPAVALHAQRWQRGGRS